MFVASYSRTMAGAKQIVEDSGIDVQNRNRRARLISDSRRWQAERAAKAEADRRRAQAATAALGLPDGITVKQVIAAVAVLHGTTYEVLVGPLKTRRKVVPARDAAIAEVYRRFYDVEAGRSLVWMGRQFGGRDHTTLLHSLKKSGLK